MDEKMNSFIELLKDESVVLQIKSGDVANALIVLKEHGIDMTEEEFKSALFSIVEESDELSLEEADMVAGGRLTVKEWWRGVKQVVKGIVDELFS